MYVIVLCMQLSNIELIFSELSGNYGVSLWFLSCLYVFNARVTLIMKINYLFNLLLNTCFKLSIFDSSRGTIVKDFSNFWSIRSSSCDTRTIPTTTETTAIYALTSFLSPKLLDCADCNTSISSTKTTTIYYDVGTPLITPTPVSSVS